MAGEYENPEEHEGKEHCDVLEGLRDQMHEQAEALEHLEVEEQLHRSVEDDREAQHSQQVVDGLLLEGRDLLRWIDHSEAEVGEVGDEAENVDPVEEALEVGVALNLHLLNLESEKEQAGEEAHDVTSDDGIVLLPRQLHEEGNKEAKAIEHEHSEGILPCLERILVISNESQQPLVSDVTFGLLEDTGGKDASIVGGPGECWLLFVVDLVIKLALLIHVLLDVLHLLLEVVLSHVEHQAVDRAVSAFGEGMPCQGLLGDLIGAASEHVLWLLVLEALKLRALGPWQAIEADLAADVEVVVGVLLRDEIGEEGWLCVRPVDNVDGHAHQVLLGLVVKWRLAAVILREHELENVVDVLILRALLRLLDVEKVVQRMIEEDVSLEDLVPIEQGATAAKSRESIIVNRLSVQRGDLVSIVVLVCKLMDEYPLQKTQERQLRGGSVPLGLCACWSSALLQQILQVLRSGFETDNAKPVEDLHSSSNVDVLQELLVEVPILGFDGHGYRWIKDHRVQDSAHTVFQDFDSVLVIEAEVMLHCLGEVGVAHNGRVLEGAFILVQFVALVLCEWNL